MTSGTVAVSLAADFVAQGTPGTPTGAESPLGQRLPEWVIQFPGWRVVAVVLIVGLGVYLSTYVVRLLGRPVARRFRRQSVAQTVLGLARLTTILFFSAAAANVVGFEIGDIVLSVTVFSAVLGLVLAPIIGSVINGLFILADQPYEIGDMIELDTGTRGFVDDITLRYTKLITLENTFLVLPNDTIRDRDVTNYSAEDERTRLQLQVLVTYESDLAQARDLVEDAARSCENVLEGGPDIRIGTARYVAGPRARIDNYGDHGVLLTLVYWARRPYKALKLRSEIQEEIWDRVHEPDVDVEFAYPHQHLVFDETSGTARVDVGFPDERARESERPVTGDVRDGAQ
jgi:small-conductance mechanosensitive channel